MIDKTELIAQIRDSVLDFGGQKAAAKEWGISAQYLNDILRGRRDVGQSVLDAMGFERIVLYKVKEGR